MANFSYVKQQPAVWDNTAKRIQDLRGNRRA